MKIILSNDDFKKLLPNIEDEENNEILAKAGLKYIEMKMKQSVSETGYLVYKYEHHLETIDESLFFLNVVKHEINPEIINDH